MRFEALHRGARSFRPVSPRGSAPWLLVAALALAWLALGSPRAALSQTLCLQPAVGVPGSPGPPIWWGAGANTSIDDPRWAGAFGQAFNTGAVDDGVFKALHDNAGGTRSLYVSWKVNYAPIQGTAPVANNVLFCGFSNSSGSQVTLLRVNLIDGNQGDAKAVNLTVKTLSGGFWTNAATPTWLSDAAFAWVKDAGNSWTLQLHVPISTAGIASGLDLDLAAPFKMWFEAQVPAPVAGNPSAVAALYKWPPGVADVTKLGLTELYPAPSTWGSARLASGPTDPACPGAISLAYSDFGTENTPSSQINWSSTAPPPPTNTFFARPLNSTGAAVPIGAITGRFRIANWGSTIGVGATWDDVPGGAAVANDVAIPVGPQPATFFPIHFDWQLQPGDYLGFQNGTKSTHQCMLVELSSNAGLTFTNKSAWRNMDFVGASRFERDAEISIRGLPPLPGGGGKRDVYLYVSTRNMPEKVSKGDSTSLKSILAAPGKGDYTVAGSRISNAAYMARIEALAPSYVVRVFHTTDRSTVIGGVEYPILEAQSSFGYYVSHEGPLSGWKADLQGARKVAPGWYKLIIPDDGVAKVKTTIESNPRPKGCLEQLTSLFQSKSGASSRNQGGAGPLLAGLAGVGLLAHWPRRKRRP